MKLNIGCGSIYKKDYINIDAFDDSVADMVMDAHNLDFDSGVVDHIECSHVIEHLGVVSAHFAISEFYRVLKPGGTLEIATPDIEQAFRNFSEKKYEDRKFLMNWIFGLDIAGMNHRYGYPEELLRELLQETGFIELKVKKLRSGTNYPELVVHCKKPLPSDAFELVSQYRHNLIQREVIDLNNQIVGMDQERLVTRTSQVIIDNSPNNEIRTHSIVNACLESPEICLVFVEFLRAHGYPVPEHVISIVAILNDLQFPEILAYLMEQMPVVENQLTALGNTLELGRKSIHKLLDPSTREETLERLKKTRLEIEEPHGMRLFSEEMVIQASLRQLALGIQAFAKDMKDIAIRHLQRSSALDRSNILAKWNLARMTTLMVDKELGLKMYESLISSRVQSLLVPDVIRFQLKNEINLIEGDQMEKLNMPVYKIP